MHFDAEQKTAKKLKIKNRKFIFTPITLQANFYNIY